MRTTPNLFDAFSKCPTKCWLRARNEATAGNAYAEWVKSQGEAYRSAQTERLLAEVSVSEFARSPSGENLKAAKWQLAADVTVSAEFHPHPGSSRREEAHSEGGSVEPEVRADQSLVTSAATNPGGSPQLEFVVETCLHAVERVPSEGRGKAAQFIPIRFIWRNKLTKDDKQLLAFDAFVLGQAIGRDIALGKIMHGDVRDYVRSSRGNEAQTPDPQLLSLSPQPADQSLLTSAATSGVRPDAWMDEPPNQPSARLSETQSQPRVTKVKTSALFGDVRKRLEKIAALLASEKPPDLVLNRHCAECEFRDRCHQKAIETDDLSLLAGMSSKERQKLRSKGIFTVTQLSYTFRPRRRPKRLRDKREKYHHALKALAIREKKIHIVGSPELKIEGMPVYLDVEGLPDRDFYYLIGLRIGHGESAVQHSLWADTVADEGKIWREFLAILETVEKPVLIHYGSYETTFLNLMQERYSNPAENAEFLDDVRNKAVNLLAHTYGQVYFPTHSNGLKAVAGFMGFTWPNPDAAGLYSVMWRWQWDGSQTPMLKQHLLAYNSADCQACELLSKALSQLPCPKGSADRPRPENFSFVTDNSPNVFSHPDWRTFEGALPELNSINRAAQWEYQRERIYLRTEKRLPFRSTRSRDAGKKMRRSESAISFPECPACPKCFRKSRDERGKASRLFQDLLFGRSLVKGRTVKYDFQQFWCETCRQTFGVPKRFHSCQGLGWNLVALYFYMAVELGFPQRPVARLFEKLFDIAITCGVGSRLKTRVGRYYEQSRQLLLLKLVDASVMHVDETTARIRSGSGYIWVFATSEVVVYLYSESREGEILQRVLGGFKGVLVSDFYPAYDSLNCPQQKCLVHLIRDMNNEVLAHPYDEQLKQIVTDFVALLKPIIETMDRFGLTKHHLRKFLRPVNHFFRRVTNTEYQSEAAQKLKQRFEKNRDRLFTFLQYDGVPWHNNNAEHAVKAYARLRCMFLGQATPKAISEYLVLLSICQTCKYMGVDFLDFLRSGEKDIHAFAESRRRRRRRSPTHELPAPPAGEPPEK